MNIFEMFIGKDKVMMEKNEKETNTTRVK